MPATRDATDLGRRFAGLRVTALQVDPSWYERHWLAERPARRGTLARLGTALASLGRLARAPYSESAASRAASSSATSASITSSNSPSMTRSILWTVRPMRWSVTRPWGKL